METTLEHQTLPSAKPGALGSAIPAIDPRDELIAAMRVELDAFRRESQWMKQMKETCRMWADAKADREALGMKRKVIDQARKLKQLEAILKEHGIAY